MSDLFVLLAYTVLAVVAVMLYRRSRKWERACLTACRQRDMWEKRCQKLESSAVRETPDA